MYHEQKFMEQKPSWIFSVANKMSCYSNDDKTIKCLADKTTSRSDKEFESGLKRVF